MVKLRHAVLLAAGLALARAHKPIADETNEVPEEMMDEQLLSLEEQIKKQESPSEDITRNLDLLAEQPAVQKKDLMYFITNYRGESIMCLFLFACFIFMFVGKRKNEQIALKWHHESLPIIQANFAYVGMEDGVERVDLEQASYSEFTFYASGRQNCFYSLFKLDMLKRHCFFSTFVADRFISSGDILTVDIPIKFADDISSVSPTPIEFFMAQKSAVKSAFTNNEHFENFITQTKTDNMLPPAPVKQGNRVAKQADHLVALAESDEVSNWLINKEIGDTLKTHGKQLVDLHITDQGIYNKYPLFMRARLDIGQDAESRQSALKCLSTVFLIMDRVVRLKLSPANKTKAEKARAKIELLKNKEKIEEKENELAMKRREEERKFNEKLKKLSPEQQQKLEEKRRKEDTKKQQKKMSKLIKK